MPSASTCSTTARSSATRPTAARRSPSCATASASTISSPGRTSARSRTRPRSPPSAASSTRWRRRSRERTVRHGHGAARLADLDDRRRRPSPARHPCRHRSAALPLPARARRHARRLAGARPGARGARRGRPVRSACPRRIGGAAGLLPARRPGRRRVRRAGRSRHRARRPRRSLARRHRRPHGGAHLPGPRRRSRPPRDRQPVQPGGRHLVRDDRAGDRDRRPRRHAAHHLRGYVPSYHRRRSPGTRPRDAIPREPGRRSAHAASRPHRLPGAPPGGRARPDGSRGVGDHPAPGARRGARGGPGARPLAAGRGARCGRRCDRSLPRRAPRRRGRREGSTMSHPEGVPYHRSLGIRVEEAASDHVRLRIPYKDENSNPGRALHGGVAASAIVIAGTLVARTGMEEHRDLAGRTLDLSVLYLAAAIGEDVIADAHVLRRGKEIVYASVEVATNAGKPIARGLVTHRVAPATPPDRELALAPETTLASDEVPELARALVSLPFIARLGLRITHMQGGRAVIEMPCKTENADRDDAVHEGALAALLDTTGAMASWSLVGLDLRYKASTVGIHV